MKCRGREVVLVVVDCNRARAVPYRLCSLLVDIEVSSGFAYLATSSNFVKKDTFTLLIDSFTHSEGISVVDAFVGTLIGQQNGGVLV